MVYTFISNHPGTSSGQLATKLDIPNPTVKKLLAKLVLKNLIEKKGKGRATSYVVL